MLLFSALRLAYMPEHIQIYLKSRIYSKTPLGAMHTLKITKYLNKTCFPAYMGRRDDFDKDLQEYLASKKKKKIDVMKMIKGIMPKPSPPPVKLPPEIQTYDSQEEEKTEEKPKVEILEEEKEPIVEEYGTEKPIWHKILEKVGLKSSGAVEKEEEFLKERGEEAKIKELVEKEIMQKDMKDLAKITLFVVKQLPPERLAEFKQSSDFSDLKKLLQKYKLIK